MIVSYLKCRCQTQTQQFRKFLYHNDNEVVDTNQWLYSEADGLNNIRYVTKWNSVIRTIFNFCLNNFIFGVKCYQFFPLFSQLLWNHFKFCAALIDFFLCLWTLHLSFIFIPFINLLLKCHDLPKTCLIIDFLTSLHCTLYVTPSLCNSMLQYI